MWLDKCAWVCIACFWGSAVLGQSAAVFGPRQAKGSIGNPEINEASGLVESVAHGRHFWTHNDSGDEARLFLIDQVANHKATYYLQGITAHDWEDIGIMERGGYPYLLIGDIGDNRGERPYVYVHVVKEPTVPLETCVVDTLPYEQINSFVLRYEDGPRDAESLFFDPIGQLLYVISKRELEVGVYKTVLPEVPTDTLILRKVATLPHTFITSATISPDGKEVLSKNLLDVFYWQRKTDETVSEMLRRPAIRMPYRPEPQGEAVAFARDGMGYYTLGEAVLGMKSVLYFYERQGPKSIY